MQRQKQAVKDKWDHPGKHVDGKYKGREKRYAFNVYTNPNLTELFVTPLTRPSLAWDIPEESWDLEDDIDESPAAADVPSL